MADHHGGDSAGFAIRAGIEVDKLSTAVIAACVLGLINIFIRPIVVILTLPLSILTLGVFYFFINAFLLELVAYFVSGFEIKNFFSAFLGSLIISIVSWLANSFITSHKIVKRTIRTTLICGKGTTVNGGRRDARFDSGDETVCQNQATAS
jgi:putative membrane protein